MEGAVRARLVLVTSHYRDHSLQRAHTHAHTPLLLVVAVVLLLLLLLHTQLLPLHGRSSEGKASARNESLPRPLTTASTHSRTHTFATGGGGGTAAAAAAAAYATPPTALAVCGRSSEGKASARNESLPRPLTTASTHSRTHTVVTGGGGGTAAAAAAAYATPPTTWKEQ